MSSERHLVLGTAGHIDHGKTSLIAALTGVDCDRLPEEKERGITIELGFAPLDLPSGTRLGVVDVPGHERLVRTMVAGATGIDMVLFVVAADEGIMPQSREHLAICDLLGVERGVVALTKIDSVDEELAELAKLEVEEELAASGLAGAPVIPVSALRGDGLDELRATLDELAASGAPALQADAPSWLAVDRSFSMRGFGTVVTGTLRGAALEEGCTVEIFPEGRREILRARVRGLQSHGASSTRVAPGSRCAVNLQGVEVAAVPRGSVLATPGRLDYRPRLGVQIQLLRNAPALRGGSSWTIHLGTAERRARVLLLDRAEIEPGGRAFAELRLQTPIPTADGDRFIVRGYARLPDAGWTIGGGRVFDAAPLHGRRPREERLADLEAMASGDSGRALAARLARMGMRGLRESELRRGVSSIAELDGVQISGDRWMDPQAFEEIIGLSVKAVESHHREHPQDPWVGLASVRSQLPPRIPEEAIRAALDRAAETGRLEASGSGVRTAGHAAHVADPELLEQVHARLASAGLGPPLLDHLAAELGSDPKQLRPVMDHLLRQQKVVRVAQGLFIDKTAIDRLREAIQAHLREHGEIDPASYKQLTGQTRKYTVPLMEYFDTQKVTVRRGNVRVLRK
jgi:selenocysteine-specific elongation factor